MQADTRCPGCGARNAPDARVCEWCGRPFLLRDQRRAGRRLWAIGAALGALIVALAVGIALLNSGELFPRSSSAPGANPTAVLPPLVSGFDAPATMPEAEPEPTPEPAQFVRVANTAGQGVILRREPNTGAARVAARAENSLLQVIGPDEPTGDRIWRQVQDAQGNRGWVPAEFLTPAPTPSS